MQVTNNNGQFSTEEEIEIELEGDVLISSNTQALELIIQSIVTALRDVSSDQEIAPAIASEVGEYE